MFISGDKLQPHKTNPQKHKSGEEKIRSTHEEAVSSS